VALFQWLEVWASGLAVASGLVVASVGVEYAWGDAEWRNVSGWSC
jgi:hypothetical protein